jgi:hypothetical protein
MTCSGTNWEVRTYGFFGTNVWSSANYDGCPPIGPYSLTSDYCGGTCAISVP